MLAFLGAASAAGRAPGAAAPLAAAPPACAPVAAHAAARGAAAAAAGEAFGGAALASPVVALVAAWGCLAAARRARGPRRSRSRVAARVHILGPKTWGPMNTPRFKAKPGAKYTYRQWNDYRGWEFHPNEFGVAIKESEGHVMQYGHVYKRGKAVMPEWAKVQLAKKEGMDKEAERASSVSKKVDELGGAGLSGCLLLDCDGTIVETERDGHRVAFNQAFKEAGYDFEWEVALYGELLTTAGGKERIARYFKDYNPDAWKQDDPPAADHPEIVKLHKRKTELFMNIAKSGSLPLREGIKELVSEALAAGWQVGVCSTSNEESVRAVVQTALPEFYDSIRIFAGDVVKNKKPDPEIYKLAAKELGVAPMKCVVVEDAAIGVKAAIAAGMKVVVTKSIYSEGEDFEGADVVLASMADSDFEALEDLLPTLDV